MVHLDNHTEAVSKSFWLSLVFDYNSCAGIAKLRVYGAAQADAVAALCTRSLAPAPVAVSVALY